MTDRTTHRGITGAFSHGESLRQVPIIINLACNILSRNIVSILLNLYSPVILIPQIGLILQILDRKLWRLISNQLTVLKGRSSSIIISSCQRDVVVNTGFINTESV